ncbi:MAG: uroporphyrinogen decarboxylase family protein [Armatimonadota bacterium]
MTLREQTLAALRGEQTERVPFTCYQGLLPEGGEAIKGLALVRSARVASIDTPGVTVSSEEIGRGRSRQTMHTPWGTLTREVATETGYGSAWTMQHWIRHPEDYAIIERVIREAEIVPTPRTIRDARERMGHRGVVLAWTARAPLQRLWIEYAGIERLSWDLADCPDAVEAVLDAMWEQSRQLMAIAAQGEAELIWLPDNITGEVAGPQWFERYLAPYYREMCEVLLPAGKLPCCHMDGMLRPIRDNIAATPLPVIEAFTPPPDGNLPLAEAAAAWPEKTLWLNFPSSVHLCEPEEIMRTTRELVEQAVGGAGFVIGVTENIPRSVGTRSLEAIARALDERCWRRGDRQ